LFAGQIVIKPNETIERGLYDLAFDCVFLKWAAHVWTLVLKAH
jgi:hypothetical protein